VEPWDNEGAERLAQYIVRVPFLQERMTYIPEHEFPDGVAKVVYEGKTSGVDETFTTLDWAGRRHVVRYYGYYSNFFNVFIQSQKEEQMITLMSVFTYGFIVLITAICIANILNTITTSITLRKREFAMLKSVGITPQGFNKMINYESMFYGLKAVLFGIPVSFAVMYVMYLVLNIKFGFIFTLPWIDICIAVIAVFVIVGISMLYSGAKIKKENIIDVLKQDII
jgi:ABC-type antimicrobial peptide transport system permease subunit